MPESEKIEYIANYGSRRKARPKVPTGLFSAPVADSVHKFHRTFPDYKPTPLVQLDQLAERLKVANVWIKDESHRFGLNAFKVLGGIHALAYICAQQLGVDPAKLSYDFLTSRATKKRLAGLVVVTASDGNHGRGVAWAAQQLGCRAVVYLPGGTAPARAEAIKEHGAKALIISGNYDDAVRRAAEHAEKHNWILLQDTAWEEYEEIPIRIMQGYLTIMHEAFEQLRGKTPTHVFVQCGVGSLAAALQAHLVQLFGDARPVFGVVEPTRAACFYKSMSSFDGKPKHCGGSKKQIEE